MACIHGYQPGECLICRTLEPAPERGTKTRTKARRHQAGETHPPVQVVDRTSASAEPRSHGGLALHVAVLVAVVALAALSVWLVASVVFVLLHLLELIAVAGIAGGLGYRLGRSRGRRER
jgi:Flp pilus assembly protein TadB